jgi:ABC-type uncharacterized transport system ATPase subunit
VAQVRRQFASNILRLSGTGSLRDIAGVIHMEQRTASDWYLTISPEIDPKAVLQAIIADPTFMVDSFEISRPSLDEIFVQVVQGDR